MQNPAFAFVEPHQVPLYPTFQPGQVTLNGSTSTLMMKLSRVWQWVCFILFHDFPCRHPIRHSWCPQETKRRKHTFFSIFQGSEILERAVPVRWCSCPGPLWHTRTSPAGFGKTSHCAVIWVSSLELGWPGTPWSHLGHLLPEVSTRMTHPNQNIDKPSRVPINSYPKQVCWQCKTGRSGWCTAKLHCHPDHW